MKDISLALGLSVDAVSKALRDSPEISSVTKSNVRAKAEELGYIKDNLALSLRRGETKSVAIFINDILNPYSCVFFAKIFAYLKTLGYVGHLSFFNKEVLDQEDIQEALVNRSCAIISLVEPSESAIALAARREIPFVLIGIYSSNEKIDCVYTDDYQGGYLVGQYFLEHHYARPLYVTNSFSETSYRRFSGFSEALRQNGVSPETIPYRNGIKVEELAYEKIKATKNDFVFCFSDYLALGLRSLLKKKRDRVKPMIFGFDNVSPFYPVVDFVDSVATDVDAIVEYSVNAEISKVNGETPYKTRIEKKFPTKLMLY